MDKRKFEEIQRRQYREAMEVSPYNKGRTVRDISNRTYVHGTRQYLRPDTIWADDRYSDVTQEDIDAARVRYAERLKREGRKLVGDLKPVDTHIDPNYPYQPPKNRHIYAQPIVKH